MLDLVSYNGLFSTNVFIHLCYFEEEEEKRKANQGDVNSTSQQETLHAIFEARSTATYQSLLYDAFHPWREKRRREVAMREAITAWPIVQQTCTLHHAFKQWRLAIVYHVVKRQGAQHIQRRFYNQWHQLYQQNRLNATRTIFDSFLFFPYFDTTYL